LTITAHLYAQISALSHKNVQGRPIEQTRHELSFMARLLGTALSVAGAPLYVLAVGVPGIAEVAAFGFMMLPLLSVVALSRSGNLALAHGINTIGITGSALVLVAWNIMPLEAALCLLILLPVEAALMMGPRPAAITGGGILAAVLCLALSEYSGVLTATYGATAWHSTFIAPSLMYMAWISFAAVRLIDVSRREMLHQPLITWH